MQLEVVNIEDVYPNENNPRKKFEGIPELAASFDLNQDRPGEPFIPPILVRDGGIYHIVDGERRYRALKHRKATKFAANVCEDFDEAYSLIAAIATDDKQPLTDLEKSRGVQQMLLLGVEPNKVEKAARGVKAKRINHAMIIVDDAAEDMTLDRLLAIDEFSDDPEVVERLTNCSEKAWWNIAEHARKERKNKQKIAEIKQALLDAGYKVTEEKGLISGFFYDCGIKSVKQVQELTDNPDDVVFRKNSYVFGYEKYVKVNEAEEAEKQKRKAEEKKLSDTIVEAEEKRDFWVAEHLAEPESIPHVEALARTAFYEANESIMNRFTDDFQIDMSCTLCKYALAVGYSKSYSSLRYRTHMFISTDIDRWYIDTVTEYLDVIDALIQDGYKPDKWEAELYQMMRDALEGAKNA